MGLIRDDDPPFWRLILLTVALVGFVVLAAQPPAESALGQEPVPEIVGMSGESGDYHLLKSTRDLVTTQWTHVRVPGIVLAVIDEADGDLHLRLSDGTVSRCDVPAYMAGTCIVVEIRPPDRERVRKPAKGDRVRVSGVSRFDRQHKWYEVHPCDRVEILGGDNALGR